MLSILYYIISVFSRHAKKKTCHIDFKNGDINSDYLVDNRDLTRLFQYLTDWDVEVEEKTLDVNGDGEINNKDLTRLYQYLSGWEVEIY